MNPTTLRYCVVFLLATAGAPACTRSSHETPKDGVADGEKEPFGRLTVDELDAKMKAAAAGQLKLAVYDNNQRETFDKGHIPSAKWVEFDAVKASDLPADKDTTLVFYCANEH